MAAVSGSAAAVVACVTVAVTVALMSSLAIKVFLRGRARVGLGRVR